MQDKVIEKLKEKLLGVKQNVPLKNYTTYKIGGPAKYFFIAKLREDLLSALALAKALKLPVFILGGGSNILVSEKGFNGLVIKIEINDIEFHGNRVITGAGVNLTKLAFMSADRSLAGFEWSAGMPGTAGGSIFGSAQAFGTKISDEVETIEAIDAKTLKTKIFTKAQCLFSLKNSIFKQEKRWVIVSAAFNLKKENSENIKDRIKKFVEYRNTKHPMNFPSAGSTFINPEQEIKNKKLLADFPELLGYNKSGTIPSGYLIAKSGLLGKKIGRAQISEKHANFIVNLGGAKSSDVLALMKLAQEEVRKKFGIKLETEVQVVGF